MTTYRLFDNGTGDYLGEATPEQVAVAYGTPGDDTVVFSIDETGRPVGVGEAPVGELRDVFVFAYEADSAPTHRKVLVYRSPVYAAAGRGGWFLADQFFMDGIWEGSDGALLVEGAYDPGVDLSATIEEQARAAAEERTGLDFSGMVHLDRGMFPTITGH